MYGYIQIKVRCTCIFTFAHCVMNCELNTHITSHSPRPRGRIRHPRLDRCASRPRTYHTRYQRSEQGYQLATSVQEPDYGERYTGEESTSRRPTINTRRQRPFSFAGEEGARVAYEEDTCAQDRDTAEAAQHDWHDWT